FNLRGRPWTDKTGKTSYFNTPSVWRLTPLGAGDGASAPEYNAAPVDITSAPAEDDLPLSILKTKRKISHLNTKQPVICPGFSVIGRAVTQRAKSNPVFE